MELNIFQQYKIDNSTELVSAMELKEAARCIRIHNKVHFAAEPNALIISKILESCAQILEQIDEKKIRYERYGRWIEHNFNETKDRLDYELPYECSECHGRQGIFPFNYCPNCGAKMEEGLSNVNEENGV